MRKLLGIAAAVTVAVSFMGCGGGTKEQSKAPVKAEEAKPPAEYQVRLDTTKGSIVIRVVREWAPRGADHFFELVRDGYYDGARFYRVRKGYIAQFGISADPKLNELYSQLKLPDDPVVQSNLRGFVSFAAEGPASRTTQVFINLKNNQALDKQGFTPFGQVVEGMEAADSLYAMYGEVEPLGGAGPDPVRLATEGDSYAARLFSNLDRIKDAEIVQTAPKSE
jgi:peptidyl-prolyl cis-trans isomerase A (cyclophilin A)